MVHAATIESLRERFPGWHIRQPGAWAKATRRGVRPTDKQLSDGLAMTLIADSVEELAAALAEQADMEDALGPTATSET